MLLLLLVLSGFAVSAQPSAPVPGRILLKLKHPVAETELTALLEPHGARQQTHLRHIDVRVLSISEDKTETVLAALRRDPNIEFAERDYFARAAVTPNDPYVVSGSEWHLATIRAPQAWDVTLGQTNVIIAILDSGINFTHPDLVGKILPGYDFVNGDSNPADDFGHGTAVAGAAAANANNGVGVAGVAPGCSLLPVKVLGASGFASYAAIAAGIDYAVAQGARVINISIAGDMSSSTLQDAVNYAWNHNAVVVAAAGNNANSLAQYPAGCSNVVAVSATTASDALAGFSSYGSGITLAAPGEGIWTTYSSVTTPYYALSGTSLASPIVAGVVALMISTNGGLSNAQIVSLLEQSADDLGAAGYDTCFGYGRVNAARAVNLAVATPGAITPPVITAQPASQTVPAGGTAIFTVGASGADPRTYQWKLNGAAIPGATGSTFAKANAQPADAGNYSVVVSNALGVAASAPATLSVKVPAPRILSLTPAGGGNVRISWSAVSGRTYRVQCSASANGATWTSFTPDILATNSTAATIDQPNGAAQRFYRIVLLP